jgi:hypothetical protein
MQDPLLTVFVGIIAFAILAQSVALVVIYFGLKRLGSRLDGVSKDLLERVDMRIQRADEMFAAVKSVAAGMEAIRDNLVQSTAVIRSRVSDLDAFLGEATRSAQLQIAAVQGFLDTSRRRLEESFNAVQQGIVTPIREIGAIIVGIRVALDVLTGRRRRPPDRFRHDDEMFI